MYIATVINVSMSTGSLQITKKSTIQKTRELENNSTVFEVIVENLEVKRFG